MASTRISTKSSRVIPQEFIRAMYEEIVPEKENDFFINEWEEKRLTHANEYDLLKNLYAQSREIEYAIHHLRNCKMKYIMQKTPDACELYLAALERLKKQCAKAAVGAMFIIDGARTLRD